jgi:hypothetical protein
VTAPFASAQERCSSSPRDSQGRTHPMCLLGKSHCTRCGLRRMIRRTGAVPPSRGHIARDTLDDTRISRAPRLRNSTSHQRQSVLSPTECLEPAWCLGLASLASKHAYAFGSPATFGVVLLTTLGDRSGGELTLLDAANGFPAARDVARCQLGGVRTGRGKNIGHPATAT